MDALIELLIKIIPYLFDQLRTDFFSTSDLILIVIIFILIAFVLILRHSKKENEKNSANFDKLKNTLLKSAGMELFPNLMYKNTLTQSFVDITLQTIGKKSKISLKHLINILYQPKDQAFIIQGGGGLGKSTLLRYLVITIAKESISKKKAAVPFFIALSEFNTLDDDKINLKLDNILSILDIENISIKKIVFCLDGFNEIKEESFAKILGKLHFFCERRQYPFCFVISVRPFFLNNCINCINYLPRATNRTSFQIKEWSSTQITKYLTKSNKEINIKEIPQNVQKLLENPFLAFIYLQQSLKTGKSKIEKVTDLMENYLNTFFFPEPDESESDQIINIPKEQSQTNRNILEALAYFMTNKNTLFFSKDSLIRYCLKMQVESSGIDLLLDKAENFGLILSIGDTPAEKKYKFRHQIVQEYLCALYIRNDITKMPNNPSSDPYWKDIPIYMFNLLDSDVEKELFIQKLMVANDFHTVAEILKRFFLKSHEKYKKEIMEYIIFNFKQFDSYAWSDEVVRLLSPYSEEILLNEIKKINEDTVAPEELYFDQNISVEDENCRDENWRVIGRSIPFIVEPNSLLKTLLADSIVVKSEHLKYHILEYILKSNALNKFKSRVNSLILTSKLAKNSKNEIVKLYELYIYLKAIGVNKKVISFISKNKWNSTLKYVEDHCDNSQTAFYLRNFWIRNHGIECLSNYLKESNYSKFSEVVINILKLEEHFPYNDLKPFYFAIHKSILISLNKLYIRNVNIEEAIRSLLRSKRLTNSRWAIKHLKTLIYRFDHHDLNFLDSLDGDNFISQEIKNIIKQRKEFFQL
ncbi:MAG: NACHT domain-containing protein [Fibromonadaceae bacterium]|jgi:hypothetical protein|nr:NACHT domain-containing protein [Fibromonadaceae bacterium]